MNFALGVAALYVANPGRIISLSTPDVLIIAIYFVTVLGIGFYLKKFAGSSSEDFFMAGRDMSAWVAGLSFLSANLGALELMGWAAAAYQYGILATHFYWIAAFPAMVFLGLVMMPFYYISNTHSVPGYLQLRYGEATRALSGISFAFMTVLMSGINMYAMALVMKVVLGWNIHFSIWVSSITVAVYVTLGGLYSAIFNEVLQFFLIWLGALVIPIAGLIEAGGWSGLVARINERVQGDYVHLWSTLGHFKDNPMGVHWTGIVFGLGGVIAFGYWTTDFLVVQRAMAAKDLRSAKLAPIIASYFKMIVPAIVILPGLLALGLLSFKLVPESAVRPGLHSYNEVLPLMLARYCGPGLLGLGVTALIAGFMSGMAGNVSAFATVWTYDIYRPYIHKRGTDRHFLLVGRWCTIVGVIVSIGTAYLVTHFQEHHGLHAGSCQLLHRALVRYGHSGDAVETSYAEGRFLGAARGNSVVRRDVYGGGDTSRMVALRSTILRCQTNGRESIPCTVVMDYLRSGNDRCKPIHSEKTCRRTAGTCICLH